mgnify:CR=1 FL=1
MKMNFPPDRIDTNSMEHFTPEQEDILLHAILSDLHIEKSLPPVPAFPSYRSVVRRRYIIRKCCIAACVALLLFMLMPGTVVPAPISEVSAAPAADSSSARVEFSVNSAVPVREVSAQMNDHTIQVEETSYQNYAVDVQENGYLLLEVYSISGMYSSQGIEIDGIDDQAPVVISHYQSGDTIVITFTDNNGVGIDYPSITCYSSDTGISSAPLYYDEKTGQVTFSLPDSSEVISIPDKNGNTLTLMLSASRTGDSPE